MDFVSNFLKKSGIKGESEEVKPEDGSPSENESKKDTSIGLGAGFVDGVSNIFKSKFKGEGNCETERKESISNDDGSEKRKKESISGAFMDKVWKTTSFFSSDANESKRKASEGSNLEANDSNEEVKEKFISEPVSQKAIDSAKSIGNFLHSVANKAGQTVTATAKHIKHTVEHNSLIADFTKEQQEFIKEHGGNIEEGEPPWVGCDDEEEVKKQIISLSQDKRNFVRYPPSGVQFDFDMQQMLPVALALLKHDPNLEKMRFDIVPKLVNEETFWRNYFYRVSIIKQSTSLSSMNRVGKGWGSSSSSSAEGPDEISPTNPEPEFLSDSIHGAVTDEDLQCGMRQLGVDSASKDDEQYEEEIAKELQEFEVVNSDMNTLSDHDLEKELAQL